MWRVGWLIEASPKTQFLPATTMPTMTARMSKDLQKVTDSCASADVMCLMWYVQCGPVKLFSASDTSICSCFDGGLLYSHILHRQHQTYYYINYHCVKCRLRRVRFRCTYGHFCHFSSLARPQRQASLWRGKRPLLLGRAAINNWRWFAMVLIDDDAAWNDLSGLLLLLAVVFGRIYEYNDLYWCVWEPKLSSAGRSLPTASVSSNNHHLTPFWLR